MIETISFNGKNYPLLQSQGFASQYAFPFAEKMCKGLGYDIGCMKREWALDGAIPIDIDFKDGYDAYRLPKQQFGIDYIFSSHCLEHLPDWVAALEYWHSELKEGGVLFLYLPNMDEQEYWRPWNNRKHIHYFNPEIFRKYMAGKGGDLWENVFITESDLNASFYVVANKKA